jgi:dolichol kinase
MTDFLWSLVSIGIFATIFLIGVLTIWKILKEKRLGFPTKDERTQKITGIVSTYTFYIGLYFTAALLLTNILNIELLGVPLLDAGDALIASILVNGLTFLIAHWYFNRKGDF